MTDGSVWMIQMPPSSCSWIAYCVGTKTMNKQRAELDDQRHPFGDLRFLLVRRIRG